METIPGLKFTYIADNQGVIKSLSATHPTRNGGLSNVRTTLIGGTSEQVRLVQPDSGGLFIVAMHPRYINRVGFTPYIRTGEMPLKQENNGQNKHSYQDEQGYSPRNGLTTELKYREDNDKNAQLAAWGGRDDRQFAHLTSEISLISSCGLPYYDIESDSYRKLESSFQLFAKPCESANRAVGVADGSDFDRAVMLIFQAVGLEHGVVVSTSKVRYS